MHSAFVLLVFLSLFSFSIAAVVDETANVSSTVSTSCVQDSDCLPLNYNPIRSCATQYRCLENQCTKVELSCDIGTCALCKNDGVCTSDECEICPDCRGGALVVQVNGKIAPEQEKADVVFVLDTSDSMEPVWQEVCDKLSQFVSNISARDINLKVQIYGLYTTNKTISKKSCYVSAAKLDNSKLKVPEGAKTAWYASNTCAADTGGAKDTVCEAWGSGAWYAVETPYADGSGWRKDSEHLMIVFADNDPSGGLHSTSSFQGFRTASCGKNSGSLSCSDPDSEMAIANNLIEAAQQSNVQLFFFHKPDVKQKDREGNLPCTSWNLQKCLEYNHLDYFSNTKDARNPNNNDALALMLRVSSKTGEFVESTRYDSGKTMDGVTKAILSVFGGLSRPILQERLCRPNENASTGCIPFTYVTIAPSQPPKLGLPDQNVLIPITLPPVPTPLPVLVQPSPTIPPQTITLSNDANQVVISVPPSPSNSSGSGSSGGGSGGSVSARSSSRISVDNGVLYIGDGNQIVNVLPDAALKAVTESNSKLEDSNLELFEGSPSSAYLSPYYNVYSVQKGKLLGLFEIEFHVTTVVDAQSGAILSTQKPFWAFLVF